MILLCFKIIVSQVMIKIDVLQESEHLEFIFSVDLVLYLILYNKYYSDSYHMQIK